MAYWKLIQEIPTNYNEDEKYKYLLERICEISEHFTNDDIHTLCVAFISEPVTLVDDSIFQYLYENPPSLPK